MSNFIAVDLCELRELIQQYCKEESDFIDLINKIQKEVDDFKWKFDIFKTLNKKEQLDRIIKLYGLQQAARYNKDRMEQSVDKLVKTIEEIINTPPEKLKENIDKKIKEWNNSLKGIGVNSIAKILAYIYPEYFAPFKADTARKYLSFLRFRKIPKTYSEFLESFKILTELVRNSLFSYCGRVDNRYLNLIVDHFGWWLVEDNDNRVKAIVKKRIQRALRILRAEREKEWLEKKDKILEVLEKYQDLVRNCSQEADEKCVGINRRLGELDKDLKNLYSVNNLNSVIWLYPNAYSKDEETLALMKSKHLKRVLKRVEELKENVDLLKDNELWNLISDIINKKESVQGLSLRNLTSYLFIFDPITFYPIVVATMNYDLFNYLRIKLKNDSKWKDIKRKLGIETMPEIDYKTFLEILHEVADEEGLSGMAEFSFYLSAFSLSKIHALSELSERCNSSYTEDGHMNLCDSKHFRSIACVISDVLDKKGQVILYGPPGTGKTWLAKKYAECLSDDFHEFVIFHQSYSYEEFIEGIWPEVMEDDVNAIEVGTGHDAKAKEAGAGAIRYLVKDGIFKRMAILATCDLLKNADAEVLGKVAGAGRYIGGDYNWCKKLVIEFLERVRELDGRTRSWLREELRKAAERSRKYVLIIDEINRGDISRIFGDLISLLEKDKRLGAVNEIIATLPYSREPFAVPPNLYVIGTMNTADRSIALVDIALRRRFGFLEMPPDPTVIEREARNGELAKALATLLRKLNRQLEEALDRDHRIGHSYFLGVESAEDLGRVWVHEVMPLLSEYFYGRWGDLREVLSQVLGSSLADKFFVKIGEDYELRDWREWYEVSGNIEELYRRVGEDIIKNLKVTETAAKEQEVPAP